MSVLELERVSYAYPGAETPALREVSMSLERGEFCVLAGLSGSGKSTLLRAAAGLVPHFHGGTFAGQVTVAGVDAREGGPAAIGAVAGTLLQDPETQIVMSAVRAELELAIESRGQAPSSVARAVEEVALALGIGELLERATAELSGGELQRVALAAALIARPPLVLLDEPTSQLDPVAGDELIWQLRRLNQESDTAVLLIEHRLERCLAAADRVIAMRDGQIACDGDPRTFLEWAAAAEPRLLTPAARLLAEAGVGPAPSGVKQARATLRRHGLLPEGEPDGDTGVERPRGPRGEQASEGSPRLGPRGEQDSEGSLRLGLRGEQDSEGSPTGLRGEGYEGPRRLEPRAERGSERPRRLGFRRKPDGPEPALRLRGVWHELRDGPAILRAVDLEVAPGEALVLMGRNGAGKSTLLRHAAGLLTPTRGSVRAAGRVALLLQNPGDYFLHERVEQEAPAEALCELGLSELASRHPRDLSGGQRQRLALAIVLAGEAPAAIALDEPTRGMDRGDKERLAAWLRARAADGVAVLVATHDCEFAAELATRAVLLADGRVIADGPIGEVLAGGWYFATETARILGGAGGALRPRDGAALLKAMRHADAPALAGEARA